MGYDIANESSLRPHGRSYVRERQEKGSRGHSGSLGCASGIVKKMLNEAFRTWRVLALPSARGL